MAGSGETPVNDNWPHEGSGPQGPTSSELEGQTSGDTKYLTNEQAYYIGEELKLTCRTEGNRQVWDSDFLPLAAFRQAEAEIELKHCQDSLGVKEEKGQLILRVADGVGEAVISQFAAFQLARYGLDSSELPLIKLDLLKRQINSDPEILDILKEALITKVSQGYIAASTLVEAAILEGKLIYRQLGDGGIIVIRLDKSQIGKFEIILNTTYQAKPGEPPPQVSWRQESKDQNYASPVISGEVQTGNLQLQRGDVIIVATDGLLKIENFEERLKKLMTQRLVAKTSSVAFAGGINEGLMELVGENSADDAAAIVYVQP